MRGQNRIVVFPMFYVATVFLILISETESNIHNKGAGLSGEFGDRTGTFTGDTNENQDFPSKKLIEEKGTKNIEESARNETQTIEESARNEKQKIEESASNETQTIGESARNETQTIEESARNETQTIGESARNETQTIGESARNETQTIGESPTNVTEPSEESGTEERQLDEGRGSNETYLVPINNMGITASKGGSFTFINEEKSKDMCPEWEKIMETLITNEKSKDTKGVHKDMANLTAITEATAFTCGSGYLCRSKTSLKRQNALCEVECDACQCDEMCHFYGDCCPDEFFAHSQDIRRGTGPVHFEYTSCCEESWTLWNGNSHIFMVTSCPESDNSSSAEKCQNPDNTDRDQATPVSDLSSRVTYRNIFCAQCHGVSDVILWTHAVSCAVDTPLHNARTRDEFWRLAISNSNMSKCIINTIPPNGIKPRECFLNDISSCNSTSDTPFCYLNDLCTSYRSTINYNQVKYRNVFCAICNGLQLNKDLSCDKSYESIPGPGMPKPLYVLLNFNPQENPTPPDNDEGSKCEADQAYDPFSNTCLAMTCSERKLLEKGECRDKFSSVSLLGYSLEVILRPANSSFRLHQKTVKEHLISTLHEVINCFQPVFISLLEFHPFIEIGGFTKDDNYADLITVYAEIVSKSTRSVSDVESNLMDLLTREFEDPAVVVTPHLCKERYKVASNYRALKGDIFPGDPFPIDDVCEGGVACLEHISFEPISLPCPFIQYVNISSQNFTFDKQTLQLKFGNHSFPLSPRDSRICGETLSICVKTVANMSKFISTGIDNNPTDDDKFLFSIASLVCMSLSLVGLLLAFLTYSAVPKLRTLPGKNNMALMFHLFWAQLVFLTTSNRTEDVLSCKAFGVLLHYFWMSTFTWMMVCAYHMYKVFVAIKAYSRDQWADRKRLAVYAGFCIIIPVCVISSCIIKHFIQSNGADIGYGGNICFLNNPTAILIFFAVPLGLIILFNSFFFTKTILSIRSVPDMKETTKSKKHHVFVYIKLSLLFGFTWVFGIMGEIFTSNVLKYIFTLLTGSQGLLIFLAYCGNKRTWALLKERFASAEKSHTSSSSKLEPTMSSIVTNQKQ